MVKIWLRYFSIGNFIIEPMVMNVAEEIIKNLVNKKDRPDKYLLQCYHDTLIYD